MARFLYAVLTCLLLALNPATSFAFSTGQFDAIADRQAYEWRSIIIDLNLVSPYYNQTGARAVWVDGLRPTAAAESLMEALSRAGEDGLEGRDYLPLALARLNGIESQSDAFGYELAMSQAFLTFARDLHSGRTTPAVTAPDIVIARKDIEPAAWLNSVQRKGVSETLNSLVPQHVQYFQLRQMLAGYRALAERGGWPLMPDGPVLKPDMIDDRVADMRRNLTARGYSGLNVAEPKRYDGDLQGVVEHFQKRHGLDADGIAGPATFQAMNITAEERVRQIIVNMERWRWLPVDLGKRHVFVNQAAFEMMTVNGGKVIDKRRVIVGKPFHKTPIFSDVIRYAEFNPTWTVPTSIATKEMLPKLRADPSYFERNDYKIYAGWSGNDPEINPYTVDWNAVSSTRFPYRIVQQPGAKNALGQVKYIFPNKFDVYLHDTPSRQLFAKTGRAFSHGCIRVNDPIGFGEVLFSIDGGISRRQIDAIVESKALKRQNFKQPIPVHLTYFSTWIDENGVPYFYADVYERDLLVEKLLFGQI